MVATTRETFRDLCLSQLGEPIIQVNVEEQQIENCIDLALSYYRDYHWDGTEKAFLAYQLQSADLTNRYIPIPDSIVDVVSVLEGNSMSATSSLFDVRYQFALNEMFNLTSTSLVPWFLAKQHISLLEEMFSSRPQIRFNRNTNRMFLDTDWSYYQVGDYIVIECYKEIDPETYPDVWKDRWLIEYTCALIQEQWGRHLTKFNLTLPGNVSYNGKELLDDARQRIKELRDELALSPPVIMPQIG